ncbi:MULTISPECIES: hypothetical protein [unclassified Mesorhizobium]|uniref:hypothetical protein n=1 Tax=unclassified Mesorhizobium TaxID=325217 RepID=UPI000FD5ACAD|nr:MULTISPECIES: hypothetical protein [unclassified Mesorhizobium]RUV90717.1 hypothetical protein EOA88_12095 [Mesorhizobium sp. M5C.F.Ca.IN.020.14.1.1]RUV30114.1 hypothetical protein EOA86_12560 [Mesorhizobium sp. M5C.F.Ca.IN.020.32.2.1]RWG47334.1 MAG: hypothetical protein EOQ62_12405 [Mesorhizobium sp.]RWH51909.1 MAG: hypothetical protein EOQ82_28500 [Mesorhizobium sp.]RWI67817.1 MAG: hypothetical protein EOR18_23025 [Mesorhizobium sp.]
MDDTGEPLDAHVDVEGAELVFHSRGGKRGAPGARNLDYGPALRILLKRIARSGHVVEGAWIDSDEVRHLPRDQRSILNGTDLDSGPRDQFKVLSSRMQAFGRPAGAPYGGSRVKKIRIGVGGLAASEDLPRLLGLEGEAGADLEDTLAAIDPEHLWNAIHQATAGETPREASPADHDVILADGMRIHPAVVVGIASRLATGREVPVENISKELSRRYHRLLEAAGYEVAPKGATLQVGDVPLSSEDREWIEGRPVLVLHLKRERAPGLARAKKHSVLKLHGRLRCERCGLDPVEAFGLPSAAACIEVHHSRLEIGRMGDGARTMLSDVQLLCANCHRIVHAMMREQQGLSL